MVTLGQYRPTQLLVTDDGEVFGGTLKSDAVRLELSSGQVTAVPLATVRRFGYRAGPASRMNCRAPAGKPLVVLRAGDRIAVEPPGGAAGVASCYGNLRLDPRHRRVGHVAGGRARGTRRAAGGRVALRRRRAPGAVRLDALAGAARGSGRPMSFRAASVRRIQLAPDVEEPRRTRRNWRCPTATCWSAG